MDIPFETIERETGGCPACGSSARSRAVVHLLARTLYGNSAPAPDWPAIPAVVYGISDWSRFADAFSHAITYRNTQFDRQLYPDAVYLDITDPPDDLLGTADAITCCDVLEHVPPHPQAAFDGLFRLLKPGGSLIFTVPYTFEKTHEHFPDLHEWTLQDLSGTRVLINRTREGKLQAFDGLVFHGGGEAVLEMRVFGLPDIARHLTQAGFIGIEVMEDDVPEFGIRIGYPWSRPLTARRPP